MLRASTGRAQDWHMTVGDRHIPPRPPGNRHRRGRSGFRRGHPGKCWSFKITPTDSNDAPLAQSMASKHSMKKIMQKYPRAQSLLRGKELPCQVGP